MKEKININELRLIPKSMGFGFCVYGEPSEEIVSWANLWGFKIVEGERGYKNILVPINFDISECFKKFIQYKYVDGFSPNLNKHLHVGHMSNFIIAKTFQAMGIGENFISIFGDTIKGDVEQSDAIRMFDIYCATFGLRISKVFFASKMKYTGNLLKNGTGKYSGTKIFEFNKNKIVGIKSDGSTSYFYQDMALAETLQESTLYMTGNEQNNHFIALNNFYPKTNHIGLGLVKLKEKMSSRVGNVIFFEDLLKDTLKKFNNDYELSYNVLAGFILKIDPKKDKKVEVEMLDNPKNSPGLYLSYTLARLTSAGVRTMKTYSFNNTRLQYKYMKALYNLRPNLLFNELIEHCKMINSMYVTHRISGNPENEVMFSNFKEDLEFGMKKLGLFLVDKV